MKRFFLIAALLAATVEAKVNVVAAYPYIADLVKEVGGEKVNVTALAKPTRDPHFIVPRPSFIAKVRNADLVVVNGGELEIGWMPPLLARSGNPDVQPGCAGYVALSDSVAMRDKPKVLSRAGGDVHAEGNPHFSVDMYQIPMMSGAIARGLCGVDSAECSFYEANAQRFADEWAEKLKGWEARLTPLKGLRVIQAHELFDYLLEDFGIETAATLEPLPGVPPTAKHLAEVIRVIKEQKITLLLTSVYFPKQAVETVAEKTGIHVVTLPHDVGALEGTDSMTEMFDTIVAVLAP